ncbi:transposase [Kitasatospora sp. NBC_01302]|uniref:transposase n=1 Tax=Kitasatospora sp. NBC_01302 TaxID=2903575 RepID=UPI003FA3A8C3
MLPAWIRQAEQSDVLPVAKFASLLRQDFDAVTAAIADEWSSGKAEGHVNRVKTIRRAMCGRAGSRLLRTRILTRTSSWTGHNIQPATTRSATEKSVPQSGQAARPNRERTPCARPS